MRRRDVLLASAVVGLSGIGLAQVINLNDAINKAGRQRMLSQRMAKSYMALGLGVMHDTADKTLAASMALFDRQLVELKAFAPTPDIKTTYQQLEAKWSEYKGALVGAKPDAKGAASVMQLSNAVLALANQGTVQLEKVSNKPIGKLVNIAGRQRMLSQRMASQYLAASWNVQAQNAKTEMLKARDEFVTALEVLRMAPEATARIKQELELADQQFVFFQAALQNLTVATTNKRPLEDVFQTSERILQVMDNITSLYSQIT
jgi:nitrate/nitrite-specific signal transduction histidine kinase